MLLAVEKGALSWDDLDLPMSLIRHDWNGSQLDVPVTFGLALDDTRLWFVAGCESPALVHPESAPGQYTPGLWRYDVAEFFLADPDTGRYLEFNLAAHGAWWSALFLAPRMPAAEEDKLPGVKTYAKNLHGGGWIAAAAIPLEVLRERVGLGEDSRMNVTFIIDSPEQKYLSVNPPQGGEPDFHQPALWTQVEIRPGKFF